MTKVEHTTTGIDSNDEGADKTDPDANITSSRERQSTHFTIAASAFGLISDGYHNNLMAMSNVVFAKLYPTIYTSAVSTRVSNALLIGDIVGQVFVGIVCDRIGRKAAMVITTCMIIIGATIGTAAHGAHGSAIGLFWCLTFARGITGVGVGGEYPAASTSASESANEKSLTSRGPVIIMVTNFVLALGGPLAVSVFLIVLSATGKNHLATVWRVCFGIGILLPVTVFAFRWKMLSSRLFRKSAIKRRVPYWLTLKRYWKALLGTCGAWFFFDFVWYPNGIFSAMVISSVIKDGDIKRTAEWQLLLETISLPGIFVGALLCNRLGRPYTMMIGFGGYVIFGLILGLGYDKLTKILPLFVVLFGLMQSFGNLGPGDMVILASAESFATPVRGTCFGLSAALGKVGAAVGIQVYKPIQEHFGKKWTFIVASIVSVCGIIITYMCVPDMTGVDLSEEDAAFLKYLTDNGWEGEVGEDNELTFIVKEIAVLQDREKEASEEGSVM